ncbi:MAG: FAD:protein FMN transferase [Bacteroidetes bacterium]|nr:FAD:protein FMN transferase [Bacteroidota bacterium]
MKKYSLVILFSCIFVAVFAAWYFFFPAFLDMVRKPEKTTALFELKGKANDVNYSIKYYDTLQVDIQKGIDSILNSINKSISLTDSTSDLYKFNHSDSCVFINGVFLDLFLVADEVYECTDSAFDPTVYTIAKVWGFGPEGSEKINSLYPNITDSHLRDSLIFEYVDSSSAQKESHMGYSKVRIGGDVLYNTFEQAADKDMQDNFACKDDNELQMDFSALANGFIADEIYSYLLYKRKLKNFLVNIGGEVIAAGSKPDGTPWLVEVNNPQKKLATKLGFKLSGDYPALAVCENYSKDKKVGKEIISSTFDPRNHLPVDNEMVAVIILGEECRKADAYATAFMVMGITESIDFVETNPYESFEAFFIYKDEKGVLKTYASPGLTEILVDSEKAAN